MGENNEKKKYTNDAVDGKDVAEHQPPVPEKSRRRNSLFGASKAPTDEPTTSDRPPTPKGRRRRHSLFGNNGGGNHQDRANDRSASRAQERKSNDRRRHSLLGSGTDTASNAPIVPRMTNPYELVNKERIRRQLHTFTRSMLLDSIAKDISIQLARSSGAECRPTDYYGNVGKGTDIWTIHQKMMAQQGTEMANIISPHFYQVGIGMSRGSDAQIYMCQLFQ
jgi:hypothetical protein